MQPEPDLKPIPLFPTLPEAARLLGLSPKTLREAAERGELPIYRVGRRWVRVNWAEAISWVESTRLPVQN